jgi:glutamate dehydrogenase
MRRATIWCLRNVSFAQGIETLVAHYAKGIRTLEKALPKVLSDAALERMRTRREAFIEKGVPESIARTFAGVRYLQRAPDVVMVAEQCHQPVEAVARVLFRSGVDLRIDRLIAESTLIEASDFYERLAINRTVDGIIQSHRAIVTRAIANKGDGDAWDRWMSSNRDAAERAGRIIEELVGERSFGLSKLTVAASQLGELAATT